MRRRGGPGPRRFAWRLQVAFIDLGLPGADGLAVAAAI
jgi:hypothetical protein